MILLQSDVKLEDLPDAIQNDVKSGAIAFVTHNVEVGTDSLTYGSLLFQPSHLILTLIVLDVVLEKILPEHMTRIVSFETVGHIAHLNLLDEHLPFRYLIGKVILEV